MQMLLNANRVNKSGRQKHTIIARHKTAQKAKLTTALYTSLLSTTKKFGVGICILGILYFHVHVLSFVILHFTLSLHAFSRTCVKFSSSKNHNYYANCIQLHNLLRHIYNLSAL